MKDELTSIVLVVVGIVMIILFLMTYLDPGLELLS